MYWSIIVVLLVLMLVINSSIRFFTLNDMVNRRRIHLLADFLYVFLNTELFYL